MTDSLHLPAAAAPAMASADAATERCGVYELRQYTLHPGRRDALIDLFEREFVDTQEAAGMVVHAQFRDLDAPDRFVWIRGFADMTVRRDALYAFYSGPAWQAHRDAANATMIDSDDVLLLRPAGPGSGIALDRPRPPAGATEAPRTLVVATIWYGKAPLDAAFDRWFERELAPVFAAAGGAPLARFANETAPNTFPRLPVREGERAYVWFAHHDDAAAYDAFRASLAASPRWRALEPVLHEKLARAPQILRLAPTARSRWRQVNVRANTSAA